MKEGCFGMVSIDFTGAITGNSGRAGSSFLEVVELLEEKVRVEFEGWAAKIVVARSLG